MFEKKKTKLDYYSRNMKEGEFKFSPSSVSKFLTNSKEWYDTHINKIFSFNGNTATVLGTCVHYMAEVYSNKGFVDDEDYQEIEQYITNHTLNPEVDTHIVREEYLDLGQTLIDYLANGPELIVEKYIGYEAYPNFYVEGSVDAMYDTTIRDYKTVKTKPSSMNKGHKLQAIIYALIQKQNGIPMDTVEIIYVQRKTKTLPSRIWEFKEEITSEEWETVHKIIKQAYLGLELVKREPSLLEVIFRDNPLSLY